MNSSEPNFAQRARTRRVLVIVSSLISVAIIATLIVAFAFGVGFDRSRRDPAHFQTFPTNDLARNEIAGSGSTTASEQTSTSFAYAPGSVAILSSTVPEHPVVVPARNSVDGQFRGRPGERYPVGNVAAEFARLSMLADAGDLQAARTLFEDLENCKHSPKTAEQLHYAVNRQRSSQRDGESAKSAESREASIAVENALYAHCSGLSETQIKQRVRFGEQLVVAGDEIARLTYLDFAYPHDAGEQLAKTLPAFQRRGLGYLQEELQRGNPMALWGLGSAYQDPGLNLKNEEKSYTYFYAYVQSPDVPTTDVAYVGLASLTESLSKEQIDRAQQNAIAIYRDCCGH